MIIFRLLLVLFLYISAADAQILYRNSFEVDANIGDIKTPVKSDIHGNDDCPIYANEARQGVLMGTPSDDWVAGQGSGSNSNRTNTDCERHGIKTQGESVTGSNIAPTCSGQRSYWAYINALDTIQKKRNRSQILMGVALADQILSLILLIGKHSHFILQKITRHKMG